MKRAWSWLLLCCVWLVPRAVRANDRVEEADQLFSEGKALWNKGDWQAACDRFRRSMALDASPSTEIKIARCSRREARPLRAAGELRTALRLIAVARVDEARRAALERVAKAELADAEAAVGHLVLEERSTRGIKVEVDHAPVTVNNGAAVDLPVEPGRHRVEARARGRGALELDVVVPGGTHTRVVLRLPRPAAPAPERWMPAPARPPSGLDARRSIGIATGAVGVAALATAAVFGGITLSKVKQSSAECDADNACSDRGIELRSEARTTQEIGLIVLAGGVVFSASGAALYFGAPR